MILAATYMWVNLPSQDDGENGQNVAFVKFFGALLLPNSFNFSTFLNCSEVLQIIISIIANVINFKWL